MLYTQLLPTLGNNGRLQAAFAPYTLPRMGLRILRFSARSVCGRPVCSGALREGMGALSPPYLIYIIIIQMGA